jgi:two-component system, chemotaxis family, sensor kinase CheA
MHKRRGVSCGGKALEEVVAEFVTEAREGLAALDHELVRLERNPHDPEALGAIFRTVHSIKGGCGFLGFNRLQNVTHAAENVLGAFRDGELPVTPEAVTIVLETVDLTSRLVEALARDGVEPAGDDTDLVDRLEALMTPAAPPAPSASMSNRPLLDRLGGEAALDMACEMAIAGLSPRPPELDPDRLQGELRDLLCALIRGKLARSDYETRLVALTAAAPTFDPRLLLSGVHEGLVALETAAEDAAELLQLVTPRVASPSPRSAAATASQEPGEPAAAGAAPQESAAEAGAAGPQTIRVGVSALEHLMTVASELVLIRNQLLQLLRDEPESPFAAPLHRLNQVTSELQEGVMTTRMQPIKGAWARLPRLVRDLARDLDKSIDLVLEGQDTELDRQVLELIKDPLTHMIRNAADHGLEPRAERRASGKPEAGRITLSARHEGGAIVIDMADDGRGLPVERIRAKALAAGVITAQQAEALSDAEVRRLIFLPGLSTAAEVTAVSGRGVGMDVVRSNIEKIGGSIEVTSAEGVGTRFTIRIPLTLSIVSALIVECCGERFAMPQSSVVELVSANDASGRSIEYLGETAVLRLRDRLLPLVSLQSLLKLPAERANTAETCIIVAQVGASSFGVIVDRVFDTEEIVVKPVATVLRHLKLFSGATILGDGAVIMILDAKGIATEAGCEDAQAACEALNDEAAVAESPERSAILLFRTVEDDLKAAPLAKVARIEEVEPGQIEFVDGRSVLQYRGRLMPVFGADLKPIRTVPDKVAPLLVFAQGDLGTGLLVKEIVDITEGVLKTELEPSSAGSLGGLIIADRATELIDVDAFWRAGHGVAAAAAAEPKVIGEAALPTAQPRRLLIVDQSPFSRLMLQPLLARAGYEVAVAAGPGAALGLHERGERYDLIVADFGRSNPDAKRMAQTFVKAVRWHATPMLGLTLEAAPGGEALDEGVVLSAVSETLAETRLQGAA